jgi:hypothetical protein
MHPRTEAPSATLPILLIHALAAAFLLLGSSLPAQADGHEERHTIYLPRVDASATELKPREHLAVGLDKACRVDDEGSLACWYLESGEPLPGLPGRYRDVDFGPEGMCGVRLDGQVLCNEAYVTGDAWSAPPGRYTQVRVAVISACALRSDGSIACWLWDGFWEGDGPRAYPGPKGIYQQIAVSGDVVCGLAADHTITCANWREGGPEWSGPTGGIAHIEMGGEADQGALLLRTDGSMLWWDAESGAMQDGPAGPYVQISWWGWPACGLRPDGGIDCWEGRSEPMLAPSGEMRTIATSDGFLCAIDEAGANRCWSWQGDGSLESLPVP